MIVMINTTIKVDVLFKSAHWLLHIHDRTCFCNALTFLLVTKHHHTPRYILLRSYSNFSMSCYTLLRSYSSFSMSCYILLRSYTSFSTSCYTFLKLYKSYDTTNYLFHRLFRIFNSAWLISLKIECNYEMTY